MKKENKNFKSRYDRNRMCYRKDKTTYIYSEYIDDGNGQGHYIDHEYHVGDMDENGRAITLEMLDKLMDFDNAEAQDTEDQERNEELLAHSDFSDGDFVETGMSRIGTVGVAGNDGMNPSGATKFGAEFIGPEAVLFDKEAEESISVKEFKEKILPLLQKNKSTLFMSALEKERHWSRLQKSRISLFLSKQLISVSKRYSRKLLTI